MEFGISLLPFIIGAVINMVLGALWYSPVLFAKPWMKEAGITQEYVEVSQGKMGKVYIFTTIMAFVTSFTIGFLILNLGITSIGQGIVFSIILWLGTNVPSIIKRWGFEDNTIKLGIINHGYDLAVYLLVSVLFILF